MLPLPENEAEWEKLNVVFATKSGDVRRNELSDFGNVRANGKIAMKLEPGDGIVGVQTCTDTDSVLLTTRDGKCIRFALSDLRIFKGRTSTGVRGVKLAEGDEVVSLALLHQVEATAAETRTYLKQASAIRRATGEENSDETPTEEPEENGNGEETILTQERYAYLAAAEQFVLTVSASGFGKRTSSYEYRVTGRGGSGIVAMGMAKKNNAVVASFPVEETDDIMLITDQGQTIRSPVSSVRIAGRSTQGVTLFRVESGERVVSVERIEETSEETEA